MRINLKGSTRIVFIFEKFVIKIPTFKSWKLFLTGILANLQERQFSKIHNKNLARVVLSDPLGLIIVMERVREIRNRGLFFVELQKICCESDLHLDFWLSDCKPENYGYNNKGKLVKLDFGN
ncbi:MAG: hypothetical protein ACRC6V_06750 [Bacteroidales bacterium]